MKTNSAYAAELTVSLSSSEPKINQKSRHEVTSLSPVERKQNQLIEQHLPLVRRVLERIRRTLPRHIDIDDLHSAGVTGLIAAAQRFDPAQHETFPGYACLRIRGAILDELRRLDWCPRRTRARNRRIQTAMQQAEQELGRPATDLEMSERMGVTVREFSKWREASRPLSFLPLDQPADQDEA
ncbi:MAG TPA: sigma-70 family RNA polymerase sigma factor, partial [Candidatus Synoicihabitans sp.]|nr:sigma-70 family RNA polymerase sigma factor [Candidatus Synoicihabitans sp.]